MQTEAKITRFEGDRSREVADCVAQEAPLEIILNGKSLAVTMRTPGDDFALAAGFLYAESVITGCQDIATMEYQGQPGDPNWQNLLQIALSPEAKAKSVRARLQRNFLATSSCGVCGKASLHAVQCKASPLPDTDFAVSPAVVRALDAPLRAAQKTFDRTGGLHAAGLFDEAGTLLSIREDVGRHNALDKLVGNEVLNGRMPLDKKLLLVSGRTSFEIMQKAAMARIPIVCAVSAPSSLAVSLAAGLNITLVGFLRGDTFNVYSAPHRIHF